MRVTGIDLGVVTGVCFGETFASTPTFLSWTLRDENRGWRGVKLMRAFTSHVESFNPERIFVESPLSMQAAQSVGTTRETIECLYGYDFLLRTLAASFGIELEPVDSQDARKHFLGFRPKGGEGKDRVLARCRQLRWEPQNQNESDAGAIWDYGCARSSQADYLKARMARPVAVAGR
jgi:hypothetical protein